MRIFKKVDGTQVDLIKHTQKVLFENDGVEIHIGCDSQSQGDYSTYAIVVAYRFGAYENHYGEKIGGKGVHYVYWRYKFPRNNDMFTRLYKEAELTIETAEWLKDKLPYLNIEIDFDFNSDKEYPSQKLVSSCVGWAQALGYKVNIKPDNQIATKAADYRCR